MGRKIVIYHSWCSDGLLAAYLICKKYPDAEPYPAVHGTTPIPDVTGRDVFIVDFSYSREILLDMKAKAKSLLVLDHHKSAQEALSGLDFCMFDMARSGCGMTWDYLYPGHQRQWIVNFTEDIDLWNFLLPKSREVNCAIRSYPLTFEALDMLEKMNPYDLAKEGEILLRSQRNMVDSIVKKAREVEIQGHKVLCVNTPVLQSEVANYLSKGRPFGVCWFESESGDRVYSLRSQEDGIDVSTIAKKYPGGGGHYHSAGYRILPGEKL